MKEFSMEFRIKSFFPLSCFALLLTGLAGLAMAADTAPAAAADDSSRTMVGSIFVSTAGSHYRSTPRIGDFITDLRDKPFGEAVIQIVDNQCAYYNSRLMPKALGISEHYDPLMRLAMGLRTEPGGVKLIAWISPYSAGNVGQSTPLPTSHVQTAHPEWFSLRADGSKADAAGNQFLEPGLPEVQQYLEGVVREIVTRYPIDGIYFDLMGDPDEDWGFHPAMIAAWREQTGKTGTPTPEDATWIAFRAGVITRALDGLTQAALQARSGVLVGVGARAECAPPAPPELFHNTQNYMRYHQDWPAWLKSAHPVTRLYLQDFKSEETDKGVFESWMQYALQATASTKAGVMVGVAGYLNEPVLALGQMRKVAESEAEGMVLADYERPVRDIDVQEPFLKAIRKTVLSPEYLKAVSQNEANARTAVEMTSTTRSAAASTSVTITSGATEPTSESEALVMPPAPKGQSTPAPAPVSEGDDVTMRSQRPVTGGENDTQTTATVAGDDSNMTRRDMLNELINDPQLNQAGEWSLIRPEEKYKNYLKQNYGNIFDNY